MNAKQLYILTNQQVKCISSLISDARIPLPRINQGGFNALDVLAKTMEITSLLARSASDRKTERERAKRLKEPNAEREREKVHIS